MTAVRTKSVTEFDRDFAANLYLKNRINFVLIAQIYGNLRPNVIKIINGSLVNTTKSNKKELIIEIYDILLLQHLHFI